jgi:hypothetical protein
MLRITCAESVVVLANENMPNNLLAIKELSVFYASNHDDVTVVVEIKKFLISGRCRRFSSNSGHGLFIPKG